MSNLNFESTSKSKSTEEVYNYFVEVRSNFSESFMKSSVFTTTAEINQTNFKKFHKDVVNILMEDDSYNKYTITSMNLLNKRYVTREEYSEMEILDMN